jgi:hypothetical protein
MPKYKGKKMTQKRIDELNQAKSINGEERYNQYVRELKHRMALAWRNKIDEQIRRIVNDRQEL